MTTRLPRFPVPAAPRLIRALALALPLLAAVVPAAALAQAAPAPSSSGSGDPTASEILRSRGAPTNRVAGGSRGPGATTADRSQVRSTAPQGAQASPAPATAAR